MEVYKELGLVSWGEAIDLKAMGFNEPCLHWYWITTDSIQHQTPKRRHDNSEVDWNNYASDLRISAPTLEQRDNFISKYDD